MLLMFDDGAAAVLLHPLADERTEAERSLEVDADHLVEQLLTDRAQRRVQRCHPDVERGQVGAVRSQERRRLKYSNKLI